jgi:hypothetical protein
MTVHRPAQTHGPISGVGAAVAQGASSTKDRLGFENWVLLVKKGIFPINEVNPRLVPLSQVHQHLDLLG